MSADAIRDCPNCKAKALEAYAPERAAVEAAYGNVPAAEYERMLAEANAGFDLASKQSPVLDRLDGWRGREHTWECLRENWEVFHSDALGKHMSSGGTHVTFSYGASCSRCDFGVSERHTFRLAPTNSEPE